MLTAASIENSRRICCERDRKGTSSNNDAKNTYQTIDPIEAMFRCTPGWVTAAASDAVSSSQVPRVTNPKRRRTVANGCGSIWYDQLISITIVRP
ncbi:MAG: hypothetical protein QM722_13850 [Piscinibacter sp.]